jgi:hypothetical protein
VSSSDGGILAEGEETSSESVLSGDSASPPCDLGLVERLLRTHPVWFLPGIQRAGAVHLLQGKEEGVSVDLLPSSICHSLIIHSEIIIIFFLNLRCLFCFHFIGWLY